MLLRTIAISLLVSGMFAAPAFAQSASGGHSSHQQHGGAGGSAATGPADMAYGEAMTRMHKDMDIKLTGNPDADFVRGMIPHHQGAVDMAKVVLEYGKDPEIKALATAIIKAQETEIEWMRAWLAKHGG